MHLIKSLVLSAIFLAGSHAHAAKETIVHIGGIAKVLTKSTSCDRNNWGRNDENACRCCITKHIDKGDRPQAALAYCSKQSKHCPDETIANIATAENLKQKNPVDSEEFTNAVSKSAFAINEVPLNEAFLKNAGSKSGELNDTTAVYFLKTAAEKGFITDYQEQLKLGEQCIEAESMGLIGAQTLQLFAIALKADEANCKSAEKKTIFILKEMKKAKDEVLNLEKIRGSAELSKYLIENSPTSGMQIALSHQNLLYRFGKYNHYMSLLPTAPGLPMSGYLEKYLKVVANPAQLPSEQEKLKRVSCAMGNGLAQFHQDTMQPQNAIFGKVIAHRDFHFNNVFIKLGDNNDDIVTLIDNESMAASLSSRQQVDLDLVRIYAHSSARFLGKSKLYYEFNKKTEGEWNALFFEPFITCYAKAYPLERLAEVKRELKKVYSNQGILTLLKNQKTLYNMFAWSKLQVEFARIIDDIK